MIKWYSVHKFEGKFAILNEFEGTTKVGRIFVPINQTAHYCPDFDNLWLEPNDLEMQACECKEIK